MTGLNELILALLFWIGAHTNYTIPKELPRIEFAPQQQIDRIVFGANAVYQDEDAYMTYVHKSRTLFILRDELWTFDPRWKQGQAKLLHELVHVMQYYNIKPLPKCIARLEPEAYQLTNKWLTEQGLPPAYSVEDIWARGLCPEDVADVDLNNDITDINEFFTKEGLK